MKKLTLVLVVVVAFAATASAQAPKPFSIYAGGAVSLENSPDAFKDGFKTGFHGMAALGLKMMPMFQVMPKIEYHKFAFDFDGIDGLDGGSLGIWMFGADGRYSLNMPSSPLKPFFVGGFGFANLKQSDFEGGLAASTLNASKAESQTKFYFNIGAGVDLASNPAFSVFLQGRYVSIATDNESLAYIPVTLGVKFF